MGAKTEEKDAQSDYQVMMKESSEKRLQDTKSLTEKEAALADVTSELQAHQDSKVSAGKELMATEKYIASLHTECDWLVKYHEMRKNARDGEIDSLNKAKAILG